MNKRKNWRVSFEQLGKASLIADAQYSGGIEKNLRAEPLSKLLGIGLMGGFRYIRRNKFVPYCALISSLTEPDWPDYLDLEKGLFIYYGDNRVAGQGLHDTNGNRILRDAFEATHLSERQKSPVFFIFTKHGDGRNYLFRGLAVPGGSGLSPEEDLVAIWKADKDGRRFQNYRAIFTILNVAETPRAWIQDMQNGEFRTINSPSPWNKWVDTGKYDALTASPVHTRRSKKDQLPCNGLEWDILNTLVDYYKKHPEGEYAFEKCAAEICMLADKKILTLDLTPPRRDGGRDGIGTYRIGTDRANIQLEFAMEAKCYPPETANGVKLTSRLISRLRHRQFGYFVTTSYVGDQAYQEIVDDVHPVVIYSGGDIARILIASGKNSSSKLLSWLTGIV